jgi:hypothetical protein
MVVVVWDILDPEAHISGSLVVVVVVHMTLHLLLEVVEVVEL